MRGRAPLLIPNIGAEEPSDREPEFGDLDGIPRVAAELWRALFADGARFVGEPSSAPDSGWPAALGPRPAQPVFAWLDVSDAAFAWLNSEPAARVARAEGRRLAGAASDIVCTVHDKAFAHAVAQREGLLPAGLGELVTVLEPELLREPARAAGIIEERIAGWPAWTGRRFTLKPRFGTSGRGRVGAVAGETGEMRAAFPRLAAAGGAMLEPWLERCEDLSAQLWIGPDAELLLLGTAELVVERSGLYRGHRGWVDDKGRVTSGSRYDESLREAAAAVARAAGDAGYRGPCGVDAFCFEREPGRVELRSVVEFNARFTLGVIAIGLLRRALPRIPPGLAPRPGERRAFHFGLVAPPRGWPPGDTDQCLVLPLARPAGRAAPALVIARDRAALDARLGPLRGASPIR